MTDSSVRSISTFDAIRFTPEIRSAYIERFEDGPDVLTLYGKALYLDRSVLESSGKTYIPMTVLATCAFILKSGPRYVEVPEPLWTRKMLHTFLLLVCAHVAGALRFRRTMTSTYCIENEDAGRIARVPEVIPRKLRVAVLRTPLCLFGLLIRRWIFGTAASRETYEAVLGPFWGYVDRRSELVWPLPSACECSKLPSKDPSRVLFLGALTTRKGIFELLAGWDELDIRGSSLNLSIMGGGDLEHLVQDWAKGKPNVKVTISPARAQIHEELRQAGVLVLLSKPERYWREQIGLPLLEGLAHGCRVVTTAQTGIASWLADNGHCVVNDAGNPAEVASALSEASEAGFWSTASLPEINGRAAAAFRMHE
ncbi:glycosyltransferase [Arthrobacter sp. SAFR-044]|uniref:glycosyltransferase n=1 Tax=Arthrobacter sp. SAFR-044 TaxID=3387278 RepID=UPI003F7BBDB4